MEARNLFGFEMIQILSITADLQDHLRRVTGRSRSLTPLQQVCTALRLHATGSMQLSLADRINVSQSTASRTVCAVTVAVLQTYPAKTISITSQIFWVA